MFGGSRYSVPPKSVGQKVTVESKFGKITVIKGKTIIAEHRQASVKGESLIDPEHVREMWKLTLDRADVPKANPAKLLIKIPDQRPLTVYEEVIG